MYNLKFKFYVNFMKTTIQFSEVFLFILCFLRSILFMLVAKQVRKKKEE